MIAATSDDQMYSLQNVHNHAAKVVFAREDMSMLDHCSRHFNGCQSKTGLFLRLPLLFSVLFLFVLFLFVFCFVCSLLLLFDGILPPYLSSVLSVDNPSR